MNSRSHLVYAGVACLLAIQAIQAVEIPENIPQKETFQKLEDYLRKGSIDVKDVGEKLSMMKDLVLQTRIDKDLRDAADLVLRLEQALDEQECDNVTYVMVSLNTIGAYPDNPNVPLDIPSHLSQSHVANVVNHLVKQLLVLCESTLERKLNEVLKRIPAEVMDRFLVFFSDDFIQQYNQTTSSPDPKLGSLSKDLFSSRRNYNRLPYTLMIDHLFRVAGHEFPADTKRIRVSPREGQSLEWLGLEQERMLKLVLDYIIQPCTIYSFYAQNLLGLYYTYSAFYGGSPDAYSLSRFVSDRSEEFKYQLFRAEFCHKYGFEPLWTHLWDEYKHLVFQEAFKSLN